MLEGKHAILEVVATISRATRLRTSTFRCRRANLTGKEVYKYDDKGNISEMTLGMTMVPGEQRSLQVRV